jgi:hypothetical protein
MTAGVGIFGTSSGFVAAWFVESPGRRSEELKAIEELSGQVAALGEEVRRLRSG